MADKMSEAMNLVLAVDKLKAVGESELARAVRDMIDRNATATSPADAALADEVTENLVALVGRLSHQLSKATPGHRLPVKAMAYLEQIGFKFHVARHGGPEAATQGKEPETIWRWYALDHTGYCYGANPPSNLPERCCLTAFHRHMDATEAAAALRARAVPDGFVLVPIYPTPDMVTEGAEEVSDYYDDGNDQRHREIARFAYKRMLKAVNPK